MTAQCRAVFVGNTLVGVKCNFVDISDDSLADVQESHAPVLSAK